MLIPDDCKMKLNALLFTRLPNLASQNAIGECCCWHMKNGGQKKCPHWGKVGLPWKEKDVDQTKTLLNNPSPSLSLHPWTKKMVKMKKKAIMIKKKTIAKKRKKKEYAVMANSQEHILSRSAPAALTKCHINCCG